MTKRRSLPSQKRAGNSPYAKYKKLPFRYSRVFNEMMAARRAGDDRKADRLAREHRKLFDIPEPMTKKDTMDRALRVTQW